MKRIIHAIFKQLPVLDEQNARRKQIRLMLPPAIVETHLLSSTETRCGKFPSEGADEIFIISFDDEQMELGNIEKRLQSVDGCISYSIEL